MQAVGADNAANTFDFTTGMIGFLNGGASLAWLSSTKAEKISGAIEASIGYSSAYNTVEEVVKNE